MRRLKIAIVLNRFLPSSGGQNYFSFLANALAKKGHDVYVFATEVEDRKPENYKVVLVPVIKRPKSLRILSFILLTRWLLRRYSFDIIHQVDEGLTMNVFNPHGGVEKAYLKQEFASIDSKLYYLVRILKRYLSLSHYLIIFLQKKQFESQNVKKIIAISKMIKEDILRHYDVSEDKVAYIFNTCDLERFCPENRHRFLEDVRFKLKIPIDALVLMFAGHNFRLKGLKILLFALKKLIEENPIREIHLIVVGRGRISQYEKLAKKLKVNEKVHFVGTVRDIEKYYAASDIYVHPTFYDSCSLTVLEALASGLPVVTTRFNGAKDIISSTEGGIVINDPSDVIELKNAISYFFEENRRIRAREIARSWVEKFSPEWHIQEILKVYYEIIEKRQ
ncbi:MAG: glycosyltransferase family 4 protein [Deltaproteobacteria bacterium]|nr:glycosyltransferase family 4 protein [Deltaproteobacteria bacterium]